MKGMAGRLYHAYRVVATGAVFLSFALASLALSFVAFPISRLLPGDPVTRELRAQRIVHWTFRGLIGLAHVLRLISVSVRGAERLRERGPHLLVANHPTLLDFVLLATLRPQLDCVAKGSYWSSPFYRGVVGSAGYVPNDLGEAFVQSCATRLRRGRSLVIFPEGTRSPKGGPGPFQRGAAHVALESGLPLLPVMISCDPPTLMRGQRWYEVAQRRIRIGIEVGEPIEPKCLVDDSDSRGTAARKLTAALRDFYEKRLQTVSA